MTISALTAAKKICILSNWSVSNLKLQKILYIAHMFFMGKNDGEPLVAEYFQAWDYGPVISEIYHEVKEYGSGPIRGAFYNVEPIAEGGLEAIEIENACSFLLDKPASRLVDFTHRKDGAWDKHYSPGRLGIIIPNDDILQEYRGLFGGN